MKRFAQYIATASVLVAALVVQGCGGGGGDTGTTVLPPITGPTVVMTGTALYASVPTNGGSGLNYGAITNKPVRGATVHALDGSTGAILAIATTSAGGTYSFTLPASTSIFLRLRAELVNTSGAATWNVAVKDNTAGDALWTVDTTSASSGTSNSVRSITAGSGWLGSNYNNSARSAAPFAILDTVYDGMQLVKSVQPSVNFPALTMYWSPNNNSANGVLTTGDIGTSFFTFDFVGSTPVRSIYVLGKENDDTDEYDPSVIAHEYGHYLQSAFSTNHSIGGAHSSGNKLDMTVAFSEGWGTAWSSMSRNNPIYVDTFGFQQSLGGLSDVSVLPTDANRGWYREDSMYASLYAFFVSRGFAPIWTAITGPMATTQDALASIFSFADAVRSASNFADSSALTNILTAQNIFAGSGADQWGAGEANSGGNGDNLPIYRPLAFGVSTPVCFIATNVRPGDTTPNKLGAVKYFRATLSGAQAGSRTVSASFGVDRDVDFEVFQGRVKLARADANSLSLGAESATVTLAAGEVIIAVADFITTSPPTGASCATVRIN